MSDSPPRPAKKAREKKSLDDLIEEASKAGKEDEADPIAPPIDLATARQEMRDRVKPQKKPATKRGSKKSLEKELQEFFAAIGLAGMMVDQYCATVWLGKAEDLARETNKAAMQSDSLYRVLSKMLETSVWAGLGGTLVAIVVPMLAHHGILPRYIAPLVGAEEPPERPKKDKKKKDAKGKGPINQEPEENLNLAKILQDNAEKMGGSVIVGNDPNVTPAPGPAAIPDLPPEVMHRA